MTNRSPFTPIARILVVTALAAAAAVPIACANDVDEEGPPATDPALDEQQGLFDCSERGDTGYTQGNAFAITVVTVDGKPVEVATANAYIVMQQAAANYGVGLRIVSGFRTMAEQQHLYYC